NVLIYMSFMSEAVLRACPRLKTIACLSTGLASHGDLGVAAELGIRFEGVKNYGDRAVAEHAVMLAMAALKRLVAMDGAVRAGRWKMQRAEEFRGKVFGVIGLGGIGAECARIAAALGARVIGWSRSGKAAGAPVEMMALNDVVARADILSLHLALTPDTEALFDDRLLARCKPGVILVNTARAALVHEAALLTHLRRGHIGHAALDVFHDEPLPADNPLIKMANTTLTPHSAWLTNQAIDKLLVGGLELLRDHIKSN
ncbi:MAG: 2-hydroxyacid dehydrogenase, partial [Paracoccaceae bacterium]